MHNKNLATYKRLGRNNLSFLRKEERKKEEVDK